MDAQHEALMRTMNERLVQMFENMRYAEAGVLVRRYAAGLPPATDSLPAP